MSAKSGHTYRIATIEWKDNDNDDMNKKNGTIAGVVMISLLVIVAIIFGIFVIRKKKGNVKDDKYSS